MSEARSERPFAKSPCHHQSSYYYYCYDYYYYYYYDYYYYDYCNYYYYYYYTASLKAQDRVRERGPQPDRMWRRGGRPRPSSPPSRPPFSSKHGWRGGRTRLRRRVHFPKQRQR